MKTHSKPTALIIIILMGLSFPNCQKSEVESNFNSGKQIAIDADPENSQTEYNDLINLISVIESLENDAIISSDIANALISKVKNAI